VVTAVAGHLGHTAIAPLVDAGRVGPALDGGDLEDPVVDGQGHDIDGDEETGFGCGHWVS
jgi:hypothetical protein